MPDKKILLVDDEQDLIKMNKIRLVGLGYSVITANDGEEALDKASKENPDLVLMDLTMPKMNGLETLSKLKDDPKTAAIPVIMLTGIGDRAEIAKAKLMGACDYILKPFNSDALLESLKKHIS